MAPGSPSVDERLVVMVEKQQGHVGVRQTAALPRLHVWCVAAGGECRRAGPEPAREYAVHD